MLRGVCAHLQPHVGESGLSLRSKAVVVISEDSSVPKVEFSLDCFDAEGTKLASWHSAPQNAGALENGVM